MIEKKEIKNKSKDILPIILVVIAIVYIYLVFNSISFTSIETRYTDYIRSVEEKRETILESVKQGEIPGQPVSVLEIPVDTVNAESYENLLIDTISGDLDNFHIRGWQDLYERGEFDCSRMTTYMWDYIRTKYKIPPKIFVSNEREHAWLALRASDVGETDRYEQWTIKGINYYFIESTYPNIVKNIQNYQMGNEIYSSSIDFYTTKIYVADDPSEANDISGKWSREFRLIKSDLDKLNAFKEG